MTVDGSIDRTRIARRGRAARRLPTVLGMQLLQRIGTGGEGEVWAAAAPDGAACAVKLIRPDVVAEPVAFVRRADALARIDDAALVRVLDARVLAAGEWAGWGAMVMELVDGEPLDEAHLGPAAFADLVPLARALDRLHDGTWSDGDPLVHRDIKPSNLIRADDGRIVLVDPSSLRTVGGDMTYVGTPLFVAPEVPSGRFGPSADVYSFAATLLALHSGARGDELAELLDDVDALDVPEAVVRGLAPDPADRPARCVEMVDTVHTIVARADGEPAPVTGVVQTPRTWWRLRLVTAALLAVIGGLLWPAPVVAAAGVAAVAGLLAIDPALRGPSLVWLPHATGRWLARTLATDDAERARVTATVHGALLLPLTPLAGLVLGYGPQMVVLGTVGQIAGVVLVCATVLVWTTVATAGQPAAGLSVARVVLAPCWVVGACLEAIGRIVVAVDDALRGDDPGDPPEDGEHTDEQAAQESTG